MYDVELAIKAQEKFCEDNDLPLFVPSDGCCYNCNRNIYSPIEHTKQTDEPWISGIKVESAGNHLITGCPHCHYSFCD